MTLPGAQPGQVVQSRAAPTGRRTWKGTRDSVAAPLRLRVRVMVVPRAGMGTGRQVDLSAEIPIPASADNFANELSTSLGVCEFGCGSRQEGAV